MNKQPETFWKDASGFLSISGISSPKLSLLSLNDVRLEISSVDFVVIGRTWLPQFPGRLPLGFQWIFCCYVTDGPQGTT